VLRGELGVSQAFLARWYYIGGGYMDVSGLVVFYMSRTSVRSLSGGESLSSCEVMLQVAVMTVVSGRTPPPP